MRRELGAFLDEVDAVDLRVEEGRVAVPDRVLGEEFSFDDSAFVAETPMGRVQLGDGFLRTEPGGSKELLRWVKYAINQRVTDRQASFVHAAAVSHEGTGYLFPAWGHTGKTNVILEFLASGYDYLSDNSCFVTASRELLAFPQNLDLFRYNFECHPFLFSAFNRKERGQLKRRLAVTQLARSLERSNWLFRAFGRWLSDRSFVSVSLPASRAVAGSKTESRAPLSKVCLLSTSRSGEIAVSEVPSARLARQLALFAQYERSRFLGSQLAREYAGFMEVEGDPLSVETSLLQRAFEAARCVEVTVPRTLHARDVHRIRKLLEEA